MMKKWLVCCLALLSSACAATQKDLQPVVKTTISTIEIAEIKTYKDLLIQQINPVISLMGTSGMILDIGLTTQRAYEYKKAAGPVREMCLNTFKQSLIDELSRGGIQARASGTKYWDYIKHKEKLNGAGAILRVELKNMGFWSNSPFMPYYPSVFVLTELIDPQTRAVLYSDRFAIGIDVTSLQMMKVLYGNINVVPNPNGTTSYDGFDKLIDNSEKSRNALLRVIKTAAEHIGRSLKGDKKYIQLTYAKTAAQIKLATSDTMIIGVNRANIREEASTRSQVITQLDKGDTVTRLRKQGKWYYVRLPDDRFAWAHQSIFLKKLDIRDNDNPKRKKIIRSSRALAKKQPSKTKKDFEFTHLNNNDKK